MAARSSLDDYYFLRHVGLFVVVGVVGVLNSVLSKPFGTSAMTGYITQVIDTIC
jgi:hypothetical protein